MSTLACKNGHTWVSSVRVGDANDPCPRCGLKWSKVVGRAGPGKVKSPSPVALEEWAKGVAESLTKAYADQGGKVPVDAVAHYAELYARRPEFKGSAAVQADAEAALRTVLLSNWTKAVAKTWGIPSPSLAKTKRGNPSKWRTVECPNGHKWTGSGTTPPAVKCPECGKKWTLVDGKEATPKPPGLTRRNPFGREHRSGYDPESTMRITKTYGVLPTGSLFIQHFRAHVPEGTYAMEIKGKHTPLISSGDYDEDQLWDLVKTLKKGWDDGDDDAGDWALTILETLGIEWV